MQAQTQCIIMICTVYEYRRKRIFFIAQKLWPIERYLNKSWALVKHVCGILVDLYYITLLPPFDDSKMGGDV